MAPVEPGVKAVPPAAPTGGLTREKIATAQEEPYDGMRGSSPLEDKPVRFRISGLLPCKSHLKSPLEERSVCIGKMQGVASLFNNLENRMAALPKPEVTMADKIYAHYEKQNEKPIYLARLGASGIGDACLRSVWLSWRAYDDKKFQGRMLRLFATGHLQEERIQDDLKNAGFEVWTHQEDGNQFTYTDETGHFVAKLDGVIRGVIGAEKTPHDLEIKTHSVESFDSLVKKGVEVSKPVHFWQMQAGMMFSKLPRALYVALCKNDEAYHIERVKPDPEVQQEIRTRITKLIEATIPPIGISPDGGAFDCRWCDMRDVCVGEKTPIKTCRSCEHVNVIPKNGEWVCGRTGEVLSNSDQKLACDDYEVLRCGQ